ncbi:MAG: diphthamide biosynthesis enzyme Dph2 [Candidatus Hydrothermarchaeales archaeon]
MYDLEIERTVEIIENNGYKRVALQLPEGLKGMATEIAETINKKTGCDVFIFGDPCYGACDLADEEAQRLGCGALFHFGHSEVLATAKLPVHYIEVKLDIDPLPLLSRNLHRLPKNLGLVTTVQHIHLLEKTKTFLEDSGIKVSIGKAQGRVKHRGQVLGCSFSSAKSVVDRVEGFLYIGTGNFHPLGVALSTGKKTFALDMEKGELRDMDKLKEPILRKRFASIAKSKDAKDFGIIVGEKAGQRRTGLAIKIKAVLEDQGKKGYLIFLKEINPDVLLPFRKLDAFVNTACPRITIDDAERYKKPLLTPIELEIVLGTRDWVDYQMDEIG